MVEANYAGELDDRMVFNTSCHMEDERNFWMYRLVCVETRDDVSMTTHPPIIMC